MNVEAENAVMRERARIREAVVRLNQVDGIIERNIKLRKDVTYIPLAEVLKILK